MIRTHHEPLSYKGNISIKGEKYLRQIQKQYAKAILNSPYKHIVTGTKNKYYIMEDKDSLQILQRAMNGEDLTRRKNRV